MLRKKNGATVKEYTRNIKVLSLIVQTLLSKIKYFKSMTCRSKSLGKQCSFETRMSPATTKSKMAIFSIIVMVKVTRLLNLGIFRRQSLVEFA